MYDIMRARDRFALTKTSQKRPQNEIALGQPGNDKATPFVSTRSMAVGYSSDPQWHRTNEQICSGKPLTPRRLHHVQAYDFWRHAKLQHPRDLEMHSQSCRPSPAAAWPTRPHSSLNSDSNSWCLLAYCNYDGWYLMMVKINNGQYRSTVVNDGQLWSMSKP